MSQQLPGERPRIEGAIGWLEHDLADRDAVEPEHRVDVPDVAIERVGKGRRELDVERGDLGEALPFPAPLARTELTNADHSCPGLSARYSATTSSSGPMRRTRP